jgi:hypothetical protein
MSASATARITEPRAKGIVASVGCDERSSALLQFARFRRGSTQMRSWAPASLCQQDVSTTRMARGRREGVSIGEVLARVPAVDDAIATR